MIKLSGVLTIRTIHGRNGAFNVGRLLTEIGEFTVKDSTIEEYEEGRYEGDFGVAGIQPAHYLTGGRLIIEVRARLASIALSGIDRLMPEDQVPVTEADPIDEPSVMQSVPAPSSTESPAISSEPSDDIAALFEPDAPLGDKVKLDPTVDRALFRQQRDALKRLGYTFQPLGQVWVRTAGQDAPEPANAAA